MTAIPKTRMVWSARGSVTAPAMLLVLCAAIVPKTVRAAGPHDPPEPPQPAKRASGERSGTLETRNGLTLHLSADLGSVRIVMLEPGETPAVKYTVHIETDAKPAVAQKLLEKYSLTAKATYAGTEIVGAVPQQSRRAGENGQFWVQFEVSVPASYSLDVNTGAGDIETRDIGGAANLVTQGGNIKTGRIGIMGMRWVAQVHPLAKLHTEGGHIQTMDVAGDLDAFTAGGHIAVGDIAGDATLRSGGGHVRAGQISGRAQLETDGGNITLKQAGSFVTVRTGGGQIDFGEVRGSVRAQTGGGGIRVITVSGPMEVESNGGSVCLTRVAGAVQAVTAGGNIQAWINPDANSRAGTVSLAGASQLSSGAGDIVVFLPRNLAATIDAFVENGAVGRIDADPALALSILSQGSRSAGPVHAMAVLNGGGIPLKLHTTVGKIKLQFLDADPELRVSLIREQRERIDRRRDLDFPAAKAGDVPVRSEEPAAADEKNDWLEGWMDQFEVWMFGGLKEDPGEFFRRLSVHPNPVYPELARHARIQGVVKLEVKVKTDGSVEVQKVLQGEPVLAEAAKEAVKKWKARPVTINGTKVETVSTVKFDFQLP